MNKKDLDRLLKDGKIRGYKHVIVTGGRDFNKTYLARDWVLQPSKSKAGFKMALALFCQEHGKPLFEEQMFHVKRKWRIDFLIPGPRVLGIEYEGIYSGTSRHTTKKGFAEDALKYRELALAGITLMRFTSKDWKQITDDLKKFYASDRK